MKKQNAYQRFLNQDENNARMQEPQETSTGLYIWEHWVCDERGRPIQIRFHAEDVNGGRTMRIDKETFLSLCTKVIAK